MRKFFETSIYSYASLCIQLRNVDVVCGGLRGGKVRAWWGGGPGGRIGPPWEVGVLDRPWKPSHA